MLLDFETPVKIQAPKLFAPGICHPLMSSSAHVFATSPVTLREPFTYQGTDPRKG